MTARARSVLVAAGAIAASAAMFYLSIGAGTAWPLAWIAPVPVLVLAHRATTRRGVVAAGAAGALAFGVGIANLLVLYAGVLPVVILAPSVIVLALAYGATTAWYAACARRAPLLAVAAFAATWTAFEWALSLASPHGTAGSIAYSQGNVPLVLQLASVVGQYGITFALCAVPAALAGLVATRTHVRARLAIVAAVPALLGLLRLADGPGATGTLRVGLASVDAAVAGAWAETEDDALAPLAAYDTAVSRAAADGARVVVLPERAFARRAAWADALDTRLAALATAHRVDVVVGVGDFARGPAQNVAVVLRPTGERATYAKRHLIPEVEDMFAPGDRGLALAQPAGAAVAICKDLDFQDVARANAGARVVFAPAWDFAVDAELHQRMAVMRAAEGGFALVRSARTGMLAVHDAWGRAIAERASAAGPAPLVVDVPLADRSTLFLATPFGVACLVLALGCAVAASASPQRR
jgi:apolipoprotein N-acyltransferase